MFEKIKEIENRYLELNKKFYKPEYSSDPQKAMEISKKISEIEDIYNLYQEYKNILSQIKEAKNILEEETDEELIEFSKNQLQEAEENKEQMEEQLKKAMLPKDPNDDKNIFLEIRPAAGWDEAWLFAMELMRMYLRYAENKWRNAEIIENSQSGIWGVKMAIIKISWEKVYSELKFESWVHRVQRIPETESWWRVHTSTITVAVLPEVEDVKIKINPDDIEMDTYAASSAGWQHANKNQTWVRLHHKPTGIIVTISDTKSQLQNKEKAYNVLKSKIYQQELEKQQKEQEDYRSNMIWGWARSEKIRTYNYPQDRLTDHRIKKSWSNLPWILDWNIDEIIEYLIMENQSQLLSKQEWN